MKRAILVLFTMLVWGNISTAQHPDFQEEYIIAEFGGYCDEDGLTYNTDYWRDFAHDANMVYVVAVEWFDAANTSLGQDSQRFTGWTPSGTARGIQSGGINSIPFAVWNINPPPLVPATHIVGYLYPATYTINFTVSYIYRDEVVLKWRITASCNIAEQTTFGASFSLLPIIDPFDLKEETNRSISVPNVAQSTGGQRIFMQEYIVPPSGGYCNLRQLTFPYDYFKHFTEDANYDYWIEFSAYDDTNTLIHTASWQTTGWSPALRMTESASWIIHFAQQGRISLPPETTFYTVTYGYQYFDVIHDDKVLAWQMSASCDVPTGATVDLRFDLLDVPYPN